MRSTITLYGIGSSIAVPPSFTYSASTPASRLATSSMKAGGKDHSRPVSRPTFTMSVSGSRLMVQVSGVPRSIMPADVLHDHPAPVRPVVRPAVPDAQRIADAPVPELAGEVFAVAAHRVVAPDGEDDVEALDRGDA